MKNKALTLTVIANMTSNYGEGLGNIGVVQKIYRSGKTYSIRSKESLKNGTKGCISRSECVKSESLRRRLYEYSSDNEN